MKRVLKLASLALVALFAVFTLVGCSKITEDFAAEINEKAEAKENYTYEELVEKLGKPTVDVSGSLGNLLGVTGVCTWADGCETAAEMEVALEDGKTVKTLVVTFLNGKATAAEYEELTK